MFMCIYIYIYILMFINVYVFYLCYKCSNEKKKKKCGFLDFKACVEKI